jgi:hypothetical protein
MRLYVFPARAVARRGEWNDLAAVLDWLGIAELSCQQINSYVAGRRAEPHNFSLLSLLISAVREFMNHLAPHRHRRGPPAGERPAPRVCVVGSRKSANIHVSSEIIWGITAQFSFFPLPFLLRENRILYKPG